MVRVLRAEFWLFMCFAEVGLGVWDLDFGIWLFSIRRVCALDLIYFCGGVGCFFCLGFGVDCALCALDLVGITF